jgi:transcriptional regulator with XRE-family HTH domain
MMPVKLKEWRKYVGMTQAELAAKAGVGHSTIMRLERDENPDLARPGTRRKLAEALGITPVDLITMPPGFEVKAPTN